MNGSSASMVGVIEKLKLRVRLSGLDRANGWTKERERSGRGREVISAAARRCCGSRDRSLLIVPTSSCALVEATSVVDERADVAVDGPMSVEADDKWPRRSFGLVKDDRTVDILVRILLAESWSGRRGVECRLSNDSAATASHGSSCPPGVALAGVGR